MFITLRFAEAKTHGVALQEDLEKLGLKVFLCNVEPGDDIAATVIRALSECKLAVILGTRTYGQKTESGFSTFEELRFIFEENKPFFLVKMCDKFDVVETRFRLTSDISYYRWRPQSPSERPPAQLSQRIIAKLGLSSEAKAKRRLSVGDKSLSEGSGAEGHAVGPVSDGAGGPSASLLSWLALHKLDSLARALADLEIESVEDAIYAVKKGWVTEEQLVSRGVKRLRAQRFLDSAKIQP